MTNPQTFRPNLNPVVYQVAHKYARNRTVLDFGGGPHIHNPNLLYIDNLWTFDLGWQRGSLEPFDVVLCSNVINVQNTEQEVDLLIAALAGVTKDVMLCNYPQSPRYSHLTKSDVIGKLRKFFSTTKDSQKPEVIVCYK